MALMAFENLYLYLYVYMKFVNSGGPTLCSAERGF